MSNVPCFERSTIERRTSLAHLVVEEYVEVRDFHQAGSSLLSVSDAQHQGADCCAEVDGAADNGGDKDQGHSD